ncbi:MAG: M28 family peptidase [Phycisphaeraceae bacterium]|nr:M28 family peptidase [Phycisphaeraceae bacterium]
MAKFRLVTRKSLKRLAILAALIAIALVVAWWVMIRMPGASHRGPLPALTEAQASLATELESHVRILAGDLAARSAFAPNRLESAAAYIESTLAAVGLSPAREWFEIASPRAQCSNIVAEIRGTTFPGEIVVIGAHYDAVMSQPGADDNASGVAAVLALAKRLAPDPQERTLRFVLFANEEPPFFKTDQMGSLVHARASKARGDRVVAMLALEMLGHYDDTPGSQRYPPGLGLLYPDRADFIAFVGNVGSRALVRRAIRVFRANASFPSQGGAIPAGIPGVDFSDHWSFNKVGYKAVMITDTAHERNPHYHTRGDTPDTLDYERMARVVEGLGHVIRDLASN